MVFLPPMPKALAFSWVNLRVPSRLSKTVTKFSLPLVVTTLVPAPEVDCCMLEDGKAASKACCKISGWSFGKMIELSKKMSGEFWTAVGVTEFIVEDTITMEGSEEAVTKVGWSILASLFPWIWSTCRIHWILINWFCDPLLQTPCSQSNSGRSREDALFCSQSGIGSKKLNLSNFRNIEKRGHFDIKEFFVITKLVQNFNIEQFS